MKHTVHVFGTKLVDYALRFTASVFIARALGPVDKGILTFATLVVSWAVMFGNCSLPDAAVFLIGRRRFAAPDVVSSMVTFSVLAGSCYAAVLIGLVYSGRLTGPDGNTAVLGLLLAIIPLNLLLENGGALLRGLSQFQAYNFFTLVSSAFFLLAIVVGVRWTAVPLDGIVRATIVSSLLNAIMLTTFLVRQTGWRWGGSLAYYQDAFRYGLRGHVRLMLANFNLRFDQLVLGKRVAPAYLGWYSVAVSLSEMVQILPDSVGVVLFPQLAGDVEQAAGRAARACRVTVFLTVLAAALLALLAKPMVWLLYGKAFLPATAALWLLAPSIVFFSISKILWNYVYAIGRPHWTIGSTGAAAAVTLAMIFPMIAHFQTLGAAVTSSCAYGVGALVDLVICLRLSGLSAREFLVVRRADFVALRASLPIVSV